MAAEPTACTTPRGRRSSYECTVTSPSHAGVGPDAAAMLMMTRGNLANISMGWVP